MLKRLSTGTVETVSSLLSKLTHELGQGTCEPPQEATTDEVKKALDFAGLSITVIAGGYHTSSSQLLLFGQISILG